MRYVFRQKFPLVIENDFSRQISLVKDGGYRQLLNIPDEFVGNVRIRVSQKSASED